MPLIVEGPAPELSPQAERPAATVDLAGALADAYVDRLTRALVAARLNANYPPVRPLRAHLGFLGPRGSRGLYPQLAIACQNGLPSAREILRVKIDRELAAPFLEQITSLPRAAPGSRMARRVAYYEQLSRTEVMTTNRMTVELRQHVPADRTAHLRVVLDRFDLALNQFVRYTILLAQQHQLWQRHVEIDIEADLAAATEGFRRTVTRFASHDAEVAFILLSRLEGITVEDVRRCRVGPLLLPGLTPGVGEPLEALLRAPAGDEAPWILCCPEDRAGRGVSEHASLDPLDRIMREALSEEARQLVDAKAAELGYRVAKARKFVCPRPLRGPLSTLCRELGAPSIVRGC